MCRGPALGSFKQQAQPANCSEGRLPGAGHRGNCPKLFMQEEDPKSEPPATIRMPARGRAKPRNAETQGRQRSLKKKKLEDIRPLFQHSLRTAVTKTLWSSHTDR